MVNLFKSEEFTKPEVNCLASYVLEMLTAIDLSRFESTFADLPADPYLDGNYRFRRLSHFQIVGDRLIQLPHRRLFQSKIYNPLMGNIIREYEELDDRLIQLQDFQRLIWEFFQLCQLCSTSTEIGVHQIRTTAAAGQLGNPAPEGIHRDGVDLVGIFSVNRQAIEGGETQLYHSPQTDRPILNKILYPGEFLIFRDNQYFHYTSPVSPSASILGTRDVFVFTCPGLFPPDENEHQQYIL